MPTLTIQLPAFPAVSHVLKDDTITIGRMKGNTIVIEDASISLMHARITRKDGFFYLKDLNSTNGTMVNGQPVSEAKLQDLDRIRFADITGQFMAEASPVASQPGLVPAIEQPAKPQPAPVSSAAAAASSSRPTPVFNLRRLFVALVPYLGGAAALVLVAFLGWNLFHVRETSTTSANSVVAASQTGQKQPSPASADKSKVGSVVSNPASTDLVPETTRATNESVSQLALALQSLDLAERRRAVTALHELGPEAKEAAPALRLALRDPDGEVQMWAALTLINNQSYDKAEIPVLIAALQHDNSVVRQVVCLSLALIPYEETEKQTVVAALTETASKDVDGDVRKAAVSVLNIIVPDDVPHAVSK